MRLLPIFLSALFFCRGAAADEEPLAHKSYDGFVIDAMLALPEGRVDRVFVLLGGSGAYGMDMDLTAASKEGKTKILWLKDVSDALVGRGFATLRYNKRSYQLQRKFQAARKSGKKVPEELEEIVGKFKANPLKAFVEDAKSFAKLARERFPRAKVCFLGASEGTHVGLWAAHELGWISGVALVGFYSQTIDTLTFEQIVYRDESYFYDMDKDEDGKLSAEELGTGGTVGFAILVRLKSFDIDRSGQIDLAEFRAFRVWAKSHIGNMAIYTRQELAYPSMESVLERATFPVAFFQGLWDNQTPAYNAMAIEAGNRLKWKKENLTFRYFPKRGHLLDPRKSYYDLAYSPIDPRALRSMVSDLDKLIPRK